LERRRARESIITDDLIRQLFEEEVGLFLKNGGYNSANSADLKMFIRNFMATLKTLKSAMVTREAIRRIPVNGV
jgi:hypothetical protein